MNNFSFWVLKLKNFHINVYFGPSDDVIFTELILPVSCLTPYGWVFHGKKSVVVQQICFYSNQAANFPVVSMNPKLSLFISLFFWFLFLNEICVFFPSHSWYLLTRSFVKLHRRRSAGKPPDMAVPPGSSRCLNNSSGLFPFICDPSVSTSIRSKLCKHEPRRTPPSRPAIKAAGWSSCRLFQPRGGGRAAMFYFKAANGAAKVNVVDKYQEEICWVFIEKQIRKK